MNMGAFVQDDSAASVKAMDVVNASLKSGELAARGALQNRALVIQVLNRAFGLSPALQTTLGKTFGPDGMRTFRKGATAADASIVAPKDLPVFTLSANEIGTIPTTLDKVLGVRDRPVDPSTPRYWLRAGELAWNPVSPPTVAAGSQAPRLAPGQFQQMPDSAATPIGDSSCNVPGVGSGTCAPTADCARSGGNSTPGHCSGAANIQCCTGLSSNSGSGSGTNPAPIDPKTLAFQRRMQRALNDGAPLPLGWFVNFKAVDGQGRFHQSAQKAPSSQVGGHETLLTDYEVTNVPGIGTIHAGTPASDDQKEAALQGTITFFRTKNSWGKAPAGFLEPLAGYNDLDATYLAGPVTVCPDAASADNGKPVGSTGVTQCSSFAPLIIDVGLPPGY
jgi:hypothetical protein